MPQGEWSWVEEEEEEEEEEPKQTLQSTNTLEYTLIFLKCMVNDRVFMNLVSHNKNFSPH
jgi:hypothetical protein